MESEDEIYKRYEAELAAIAALDRRYYVNPSPTAADRRAYAARQLLLQEARSRFYAELDAYRERRLRQFRQFCFKVRGSAPSRPN